MPVSKPRKKKNESRSVESAITEPVPNPTWWAPVMVALFIIGLVWVVVTYITQSAFPIPKIGQWNLAVGFAIIMVGFMMTMRWR